MTLVDRVRDGHLSDQKVLKAEFRRLSLLVHPDTSGSPGEAFVALQADYAQAAALLHRPSPPTPLVFELKTFCQLLRRAHALGLPARRLAHVSANKKLMESLRQTAALHSPALGDAVTAYFTNYDRKEGPEYNVLELERCFLGGLVNFLDAVLFHEEIGDRSRRMVLSYLDEAENRLEKQPEHPLAGANAILKWMKAELQSPSEIRHSRAR